MPIHKQCPFCKEQIKAEAIKCRFCGEFLDQFNPQQEIRNDATTTSIKSEPLISTSGRIGRLDFFAYVAMTAIVGAFGSAFLTIDNIILQLFGFGVLIIAAIFNVTSTIKRFHDLSLTGWTYLIFFIPLVNAIFFLLLILLPGSIGANNYGEPPK